MLGRELTADVLRCLTHAETLDTSGSGTVSGIDQNGKNKVKRYTARATYQTDPVRSEEDPAVRRACVLLLLILERMRPTRTGGARALSKALWLGRLSGGGGGRWGLADKVGVSVRMLEHYLAVLAPIVSRWQPPPGTVPGFTGRRSGHAYAIYELTREMPREAKIALGGSWVRRPRPERAAHDVAPDLARSERESSTHGRAAETPRVAPAGVLGSPRTGPQGSADPFLRLVPV